MKASPLKTLWFYNGAATFAVLVMAACLGSAGTNGGASAIQEPAATAQPAATAVATFNLSAQQFVDAFNISAARVENGQHDDGIAGCEPAGDGIIDCTMKDDGFVASSKAMAAIGVPYPDRQKTLDEHIMLFTAEERIARIEVRGGHEPGHVLHLTGTIADTATALGADLTDHQVTFALLNELGLMHEPPAAGTQVSAHKPYAEIACASMSADSAAYSCAFTPVGHPVKLALRAPPSTPAAQSAGGATLTDLGSGTGAIWLRADEETRGLYAATGVALIDYQRNIGMDDAGQQAIAVWLKQCMDRKAPQSPGVALTTILNACMNSMTPRDIVAITAAQEAVRNGQ